MINSISEQREVDREERMDERTEKRDSFVLVFKVKGAFPSDRFIVTDVRFY